MLDRETSVGIWARIVYFSMMIMMARSAMMVERFWPSIWILPRHIILAHSFQRKAGIRRPSKFRSCTLSAHREQRKHRSPPAATAPFFLALHRPWPYQIAQPRTILPKSQVRLSVSFCPSNPLALRVLPRRRSMSPPIHHCSVRLSPRLTKKEPD